MWKRVPAQLGRYCGLYQRKLAPKINEQKLSYCVTVQHRLCSSSSHTTNRLQASLEPDEPPNPPEGSYFKKRAPKKKTDIDDDQIFSMEKLEQVLKEMHKELDYDNDQPVPDMFNPYGDPAKRCILCQYNVKLDYKNTRLLSQFVSPYTGRIYGRQLTGLCIPMQREISRLIKLSRQFAYMPFTHKKSEYFDDPKIFDAFSSK